jgi:hypothetical protein
MSASRRLLLAAATAILGLALAAPAALGATTVEVERSVDVHFDAVAFGASVDCGFTVEIHTVGKGVVVSRYQDGRLVSQTVQFVWTGYLLNPANGRTVDSRVAGPERITYLPDGTIIDAAMGSTHRNVPGAGLVSGFIGRSYVELVATGELDEDGFPIFDVVDESFSGQWLGNGGLCEFLA